MSFTSFVAHTFGIKSFLAVTANFGVHTQKFRHSTLVSKPSCLSVLAVNATLYPLLFNPEHLFHYNNNHMHAMHAHSTNNGDLDGEGDGECVCVGGVECKKG